MPSETHEATPAAALTTAGRALRRAREARHETLVEAADAIRVSAQYVQALERDAPLDAFPAPAYARMFLRSYARHLGLEEEPLAGLFAAMHGEKVGHVPAPVAVKELQNTGRRSKGPLTVTPDKRSPRRRIPSRRSRRPVRILPGRPLPKAPSRLVPLLAGVLVLAMLVVAGAVFLGSRGGGAPKTSASAPPGAVTPPPSYLPRGGRVILPRYRVVGYYGAPNSRLLGILGIPPAQAAAQLVQQTSEFRNAPDHRPAIPAMELIATVALRAPNDGTYSQRQNIVAIRTYLEAARKIKALFIIDIQPGRADFLDQVKPYEALLKEPDVSLALDPEWRVGPDQVPGQVIGSVDASEVNRVSAYLAGLIKENNLPQKMLVIHQFTSDMVKRKSAIVTRPGLAIVFNVDGFGGREAKISKYQAFTVGKQAKGFHGFKLFYQQDVNLLASLDVLNLYPRPDFVLYQ